MSKLATKNKIAVLGFFLAVFICSASVFASTNNDPSLLFSADVKPSSFGTNVHNFWNAIKRNIFGASEVLVTDTYPQTEVAPGDLTPSPTPSTQPGLVVISNTPKKSLPKQVIQTPRSSTSSDSAILAIIKGLLGQKEYQDLLRGPKGESAVVNTGPTSQTPQPSGPAVIPAVYVSGGYVQPNPNINFAGAVLFNATNISSSTLSTGTANISSLNVSGNSVLSGNLTITGNIVGNVVGTINPSFTLGSVPFQGTTGLSQDNSNLFWDDTNNRLGIGTASPSTNLQINSAAGGTTGVRISNASVDYTQAIVSGSGSIKMLSSIGGYYELFNSGNFTINGGFTSSGHMLFTADNTYDIGASGATRPRVIYTGGNINSGAQVNATTDVTLGAGNYLQFIGRTILASNADGNLRLMNAAANSFGLLQLGGTTSSFPAIKRNGAGIDFRLADDSADTSITAAGQTWSGNSIYATDNTYDIGASGATRPRTGYFGTSLNVTNAVNGTPALVQLSNTAGGGLSKVALGTNNNNTKLGLYSFGSSYASSGQYQANTSLIESAGDLYVNPSSGNLVVYSGNVGIGNTGPSYKLDVSGDIRATGLGRFQTGGMFYGNVSPDAGITGQLLLYTSAGASFVHAYNGGSYGLLSFRGSSFSYYTGQGSYGQMSLSNAGTLTLNDSNTNTANVTLNNLDAATYKVDATGTSRFATAVQTPLVIGGTTTTSPLTLRSTSGVGTTGADIIFQTGSNGGTEAMRILNSGNVGIGTSSPTSILHIGTTNSNSNILTIDRGSTGWDGQVYFRNNGTSEGWKIGYQAGNNSFKIVDNDAGNIPFTIEDGPDNNFFVITAGTSAVGVPSRVGIGVAAPLATLHVAKNGIESVPGQLNSGTWYTGGTTTTTKPYVLIEPTGTTSTAWSTSGTGLGINSASGFTGNLIDAQLAGVSKFKVDNAGVITFGNGSTITSAASGAGAGITLGTNGSGRSYLVGIEHYATQYGAFHFTTLNNYASAADYFARFDVQTGTVINMAATSGTIQGVNINTLVGFAPTSGTAVYNHLDVTPIINQTGGASGITRGLYINPTLTAAADFRALDINTASGVTAIQIGTGVKLAQYSGAELVFNVMGSNILKVRSASVVFDMPMQFGSAVDAPQIKNNGNNLYFQRLDGTFQNVGIGMTTPGYKLDVKDAAAQQARFYGYWNGSVSNDNGEIFIGSNGSLQGKLGYTGTGGKLYLENTYANDGSQLNLRVHNTAASTIDALTILGSGNVGIGTTVPGSRLTVQAPSDDSNWISLQRSAANLELFNIKMTGGGSEDFSINTNTRSNALYLARTTNFAGINSIAIGDNGGASTTTGLLVASTVVSNSSMPINAYDDTAAATGVGGGIDFWGKNGSTSSAGARIRALKESTGTRKFDLAFYTNTDGGNASYADLVEQMRILSNGNVGIGTNNPGKKLEVSGDIQVGDIYFNSISSVNHYIYGNGASRYIQMAGTGGQSDFIFGNQGGRGISVYDTDNSRTVGTWNRDSLILYSSSNANRNLTISTVGGAFSIKPASEGGGVTGQSLLVSASDGGSVTSNGGDLTLTGGTKGASATTNGNVILAPTVGKVGIQNTAPGYALHVGSSATTDATTLIRLEDANSTCDFNADAGGPTCGSDMTLKKDIASLDTVDLLTRVSALNPVEYHWLTQDTLESLQHGFIAQEVEAQFPDLVTEHTWIDGSTKKFLNMGGLMPYVVGAVKEINIKVTGIENIDDAVPFTNNLRAWLANATNRITRIFTGEICLMDADGTSECLNKNELHQLKQLLNNQVPPTDGGQGSTNPSPGDIPPVDNTPPPPTDTPPADQTPTPTP